MTLCCQHYFPEKATAFYRRTVMVMGWNSHALMRAWHLQQSSTQIIDETEACLLKWRYCYCSNGLDGVTGEQEIILDDPAFVFKFRCTCQPLGRHANMWLGHSVVRHQWLATEPRHQHQAIRPFTRTTCDSRTNFLTPALVSQHQTLDCQDCVYMPSSNWQYGVLGRWPMHGMDMYVVGWLQDVGQQQL
jgi:hypothetical protein